MKKVLKIFLKWTGIVVGIIVVLVLLDITVLANPGLFFQEEKQYGSITVYSEEPIGEKTDSIMSEVLYRLEK